MNTTTSRTPIAFFFVNINLRDNCPFFGPCFNDNCETPDSKLFCDVAVVALEVVV